MGRERWSRGQRVACSEHLPIGELPPILESQGTYVPITAMRIDDRSIATWLLEATLFTSETDSTDFNVLSHSPALFPFQVDPLIALQFDAVGQS